MAPHGGAPNIISVFAFKHHAFQHFESVTVATEGVGYSRLIVNVDIHRIFHVPTKEKKPKPIRSVSLENMKGSQPELSSNRAYERSKLNMS